MRVVKSLEPFLGLWIFLKELIFPPICPQAPRTTPSPFPSHTPMETVKMENAFRNHIFYVIINYSIYPISRRDCNTNQPTNSMMQLMMYPRGKTAFIRNIRYPSDIPYHTTNRWDSCLFISCLFLVYLLSTSLYWRFKIQDRSRPFMIQWCAQEHEGEHFSSTFL